MIAGLETPTSGEILIGGQVVNRLSPRERRIAMVFQSYALYPHLTVYKNIAFPLKAQKVPKDQHRKKVEWAAGLLGIGKLLDRKPRELSGGERQRVALARAIVREPAVFLLDEPLSNLDAKLRASAREELEQFHKSVGTTTIYVTHDQVEAMAMGDRVVVMNFGQVRQIGTAAEVYDESGRHVRRDLPRLAADEPRRAGRRHRGIPPGALLPRHAARGPGSRAGGNPCLRPRGAVRLAALPGQSPGVPGRGTARLRDPRGRPVRAERRSSRACPPTHAASYEIGSRARLRGRRRGTCKFFDRETQKRTQPRHDPWQ